MLRASPHPAGRHVATRYEPGRAGTPTRDTIEPVMPAVESLAILAGVLLNWIQGKHTA
jgi:hypothetical protein